MFGKRYGKQTVAEIVFTCGGFWLIQSRITERFQNRFAVDDPRRPDTICYHVTVKSSCSQQQ